MTKIIMVYASMTGNTQQMADLIAEGIRMAGEEVTVREGMFASAKELEAYDGILLGSYTWGDGEIPDEFLDFYDEMDGLDLHDKRGAVFGSCDSSYDSFGAAVDTLVEKLKELGVEVVQEGLKVELSPTKEEEQICKAFGVQFVQHLHTNLTPN